MTDQPTETIRHSLKHELPSDESEGEKTNNDKKLERKYKINSTLLHKVRKEQTLRELGNKYFYQVCSQQSKLFK